MVAGQIYSKHDYNSKINCLSSEDLHRATVISLRLKLSIHIMWCLYMYTEIIWRNVLHAFVCLSEKYIFYRLFHSAFHRRGNIPYLLNIPIASLGGRPCIEYIICLQGCVHRWAQYPKSGYFRLKHLLLITWGDRHADSSSVEFKPHAA